MSRPEPSFYSIVAESPEQGNTVTREFTQSVLVAAQIRQLYSLFKGIEFDWEKLDLVELLNIVFDSTIISKFAAIVIKEKGVKLQDKNLEELTEFIDNNFPQDILIKIATDFFSLNGISKLLQGGTLKSLREAVTKITDSAKTLTL